MSAKQTFEREFEVERLAELFRDKVAHTATIGKDGVHPSAFGESLEFEVHQIADRIRSGAYRFTTYKQKLILKGALKPPRMISIASVRDRLTLRALNNCLVEIFSDARLPPAHYIISELSSFIKPLGDDYSFIQIDIKDFYPSVSHLELEKRLTARIRYRPFVDLVIKAIQTPTSELKATQINTTGIPQGLSISNILSSIYMRLFDRSAKARFTYFRYVDDIVIVCLTTHASRNFQLVQRRLKKIGLSSHELEQGSKTKIVPLTHGIDYLGYHLTPALVSVRKSSYRRMIQNIMTVMTGAKYSANSAKILLRLNIKITGCIFDGKRMGWMFFFSLTEDTAQLKRLDRFVRKTWEALGMENYGRPKTFVKAFHEIKFNLANSRYIPRFDEYTMTQKVELISQMLGRDTSEVSSWTPDRIDQHFFRLIRREVAELERDVTPVS